MSQRVHDIPTTIEVNADVGATLRVFAASDQAANSTKPTHVCLMFDIEDQNYSVVIAIANQRNLDLLIDALIRHGNTVW